MGENAADRKILVRYGGIIQVKILYGVVGEGMGHAIRSRVVLEHLVARGHEVEVMASQRAVDFLGSRFRAVHRIHGMHIIYEENRVRRGKTVWTNLRDGVAALPDQLQAYFDLADHFRPQAAISDFETWTYLYAKAHRLPVFSVDNMQVINRCFHPREIIEDHRAEFELVRMFVKSKLPFCDHYLIASFFSAPVRKERTSVYPPILRPEILNAKRTRGGHLLVYQTAEGHEDLARILASLPMECRVYGMRRSIQQEQVEGNVRYRPFSESQFIEDLASARAVIAGGGFTLMSEAVYLRKPMLSMPVAHQFEQLINALYLEREGYGRYARTADEQEIRDFLDAVPECEQRLQSYSQDGNRLLLEALDMHLEHAVSAS